MLSFLTRRALRLAACAGLVLSSACHMTETAPKDMSHKGGPVLVATWPFGKQATDRGLEVMQSGASALDGIEAGVGLIESLGSDGSVGLAGRPNAAGYAQLDACIMNGPDHNAGSVAAVEGIVHPISAARRVMEDSPHVMLVGEGARWFALQHGLESVDVAAHAQKKTDWQKENMTLPTGGERGHDTIALLVLDGQGDLAGGCSTSGAGGKWPGRVGDSPILGSGLYVDNQVGAAGGTGLGENIMRYSASAMIVEFMRQGMHPTLACETMIHRIAATDPRGYDLEICFIALDRQGRTGAACSNGKFPYAVTTATGSEVFVVQAVQQR